MHYLVVTRAAMLFALHKNRMACSSAMHQKLHHVCICILIISSLACMISQDFFGLRLAGLPFLPRKTTPKKSTKNQVAIQDGQNENMNFKTL